MMEFFVPGVPAPGGSKTNYGHGRIVDSCKRNKPWRAMVAFAAMQAGCKPMDGPLVLEVTFTMPRPKGHYRKDGTLKPSAPKHPTTRPDATKLLRSTEDALLGICWHDDAQVIRQVVVKRYQGTWLPGASIKIEALID